MKYLLVAVAVAVAVVALSGLTAHPAQAAPMHQAQAYHVVQPGQTVFCIARGYHVNPWSIAYANGLANPNYLYPGQTLAIPYGPYWYVPGPTCWPQAGWPPGQPGKPGHPGKPDHPGQPMPPPQPAPPVACACTTYHVVCAGETLSSIALKYGVNPVQLSQCNGLANPNYIQAGQRLCIPGGGGHPGKPMHPVAPPQPEPYHGGHGG